MANNIRLFMYILLEYLICKNLDHPVKGESVRAPPHYYGSVMQFYDSLSRSKLH